MCKIIVENSSESRLEGKSLEFFGHVKHTILPRNLSL